MYGKIWDFGDTQLNGWVRSLSLDDSNFITEDWSQSTATTDAWIRGVQFYVDVYQKYKLSSPNTPQSTDEEAVEQLIRGQKSIVHADILNRGTLLDKIPDQMADGTIMWGPHFPISGGTSGSQTLPVVRDLRDRAPGGRRCRDQAAGGLGADQGMVPAGEPGGLRQDRRPVRAQGRVARS